MRDLTRRFIQRRKLTRPQIGWLIHHTVTTIRAGASVAEEIAHIDAINRWHLNVREFAVGIGYHVLVFPSGRAYQVGVYDTQRAHVRNKNHKFLGLAFVGTFSATRWPSGKMLRAAAQVIKDSSRPVIGGHKSEQSDTDCPGGWNVDWVQNNVAALMPKLQVEDMDMWRAISTAIVSRRYRWVRNERGRLVYELELKGWVNPSP